ncbi:MAG: hypothetical protein EBS27_01855 [Actinobacteria bacterium]|nr:hypothetical protein [Actinomycetota bacterium]
MTLQLSVDSAAWGRHVSETANSLGDLIPVVKGNGYGFGRPTLIEHAKKLSSDIAVGTIFEANDVPSDCRAFVLTPVGKVLPPAKNLAGAKSWCRNQRHYFERRLKFAVARQPYRCREPRQSA